MKFIVLLAITSITGCCNPFVSYPYPTAIVDRDVETTRVLVIENVERTMVDISPKWDLGRVGLKPGKGAVLHLTRTTAYSDKDDDYHVISDTLRDRRVDHLWIDIPVDTAIDQEIRVKLGSDDSGFYEVDNLDKNGRLISTAIVVGTLRKRLDHPEFTVFEIDLKVTPYRPFLGRPWAVSGHVVAMNEDAKAYPAAVLNESASDQ